MLGCLPRDKHGNLLDNPTTGSIKIAADESIRPLIEAELDSFLGAYQYASIKCTYTSEPEAMAALLNDSVRLSIVTRKLSESEMEVFNKVRIVPFQTVVARDGVAMILNRENPDSVIQFTDFQSMIQGKIVDWKNLNKQSNLGDIEVVFDNPRSGIIRYLNDSVQHFDKLPKNFYAVSSNSAVIDYVSKKKNAIGLIGLSWISDRDDATVKQFLKTIRVARVQKDGDAVQPYQAYIANGEYPLRRHVYIISREARMGLGSGFTAYVAGDKGQRIVLKSGMVPATMPVRLVEFRKSKIQE